LLYKDKKGIEVYDKEMCIIPKEDRSLAMYEADSQKRAQRAQDFLNEHKDDIEKLKERLRKEGPLSSVHTKDERRVGMYWSEKHWGNVALESLWRAHHAVIAQREGNRRMYHLSELHDRQSHESLQVNTHTLQELILRRLTSVALLPKTGSGTGWQGVAPATIVAAEIKKMIAEGILEEIHVEESKKIYVVKAEDVPLIEKPIPSLTNKKMVFIAPLDTLMWDRAMIKDLFDFDYTWEVYVPAHKRKFGYYVLPILYGDELIGRIEPVFKDKKLHIKQLWKEDNASWSSHIEKAYKEAIEQFTQYLKSN
jgi:uncharacterized protein YcaQ